MVSSVTACAVLITVVLAQCPIISAEHSSDAIIARADIAITATCNVFRTVGATYRLIVVVPLVENARANNILVAACLDLAANIVTVIPAL
jgi:voltage-gated potassium channel Kch